MMQQLYCVLIIVLMRNEVCIQYFKVFFDNNFVTPKNKARVIPKIIPKFSQS